MATPASGTGRTTPNRNSSTRCATSGRSGSTAFPGNENGPRPGEAAARSNAELELPAISGHPDRPAGIVPSRRDSDADPGGVVVRPRVAGGVVVGRGVIPRIARGVVIGAGVVVRARVVVVRV